MNHHPLVAAASLAATLAISGCGHTDYRALVAGSGVTTPSTGPVAAGPLGRAGRVSLEGSYTQNIAAVTGPTPVEGAGEARAVTSVVRGRVSYTLPGDVELGLSGHVTDSRWSTVTASGTLPRDPGGRTLGGAGVQARAMVVGDASLGIGLLGELAIFQAPYGQHIALSATYRPVYGSGSTRQETRDVASTTVLVEPQGGVFGVFSPMSALRLTLGATAGLRHEVRTAYTDQYSCDALGCIDDRPSPFASEAQVTGFASAGYSFGVATLFGQIAVNAYGDTPFGATIGLRVTP